MNKISSKMLLTKKAILMTFLYMSSVFIVNCAWGGSGKWERNHIRVSKDVIQNAILIKFKFIDYAFGPANETGYLEWCVFFYSTDYKNYIELMKTETCNQDRKYSSWLYMYNKLKGAKLEFKGCYYPADGTLWADKVTMQRIEVGHHGKEAYFSIKWLLTQPFENIKCIKAMGRWHVNCVDTIQYIFQYYDVKLLKSALYAELETDSKQKNVNLTRIDSIGINAVRVYKEAGAIVIKGTNKGENINIYTTTGELIKSIAANKDVVKIKLPVNKIYIVNNGKARYKVAL